MPKKFSITESAVKGLFSPGSTLNYKGEQLTVKEAGKPSPSAGECKTDVFVSTVNQNSQERVFKISIKQNNADFLENKISMARALQIFGPNASSIIKQSVFSIKSGFSNDTLIYFKKYGNTEENSIKLGWRLDIVNKPNGGKSGQLSLNSQQLMDVYAGTNLDASKKNSIVNGKTIQNSGVANYIYVTSSVPGNAQTVLNNLVPIQNYIQNKKIYFACKAVNYRANKDKYERSRALCVYINWSLRAGRLHADLIFHNPLNKRSNDVAGPLRAILRSQGFNSSNFATLENQLASNVKYYK